MNAANIKQGVFNLDQKLLFLLSTYITSLVIIGVSGSFTTELFQENNFMIGEATAKGVNISARISNFYTLLFVGLGAFIVSFFTLHKLIKPFIDGIDRKKELIVILSLQIILGAFYFFNSEASESDNVLNLSILLLFSLEIIEFALNKRFSFFKDEVLKSTFISIISLYLVTENIYITTTTVIVLLLLLNLEVIQNKFNGIIIILTALPVMLFFTVEVTLILNQNGFYNWHYWLTGLLVLMLLLTIIYFRKVNQISLGGVIFKWQAPLVILGSCIYYYYSPIIVFSGDLFETANNLNSVMMSEVHGTTFFTDYISSHLLNDYLWMKLYVLLNGYENDTSQLIYYGFSFFVYLLAIYYFLRAYFKSHFGVILFILFIPYVHFYFTYGYAFALIPLVFLHRFFTAKEVRYLWWFGITSTLTIFWRLDLGIATIGASVIIFILLFIAEKKLRQTLIKIGAALSIFYGTIFAVYYSYCSALIKEALHYFGGSQAHGNSLLTVERSNLFYLDYFILPALVSFIVLFLLVNLKRFKSESYFWAIMFFAGFYFFNYQRGLVRHSFIETNESYIASFAWVIFILTYLRFYKKELSVGFFSVLLIGGFLLSIHSVEKKSSLINEEKVFSVNHLPKIDGEKLARATENVDFVKYRKPVVDFLRNNLKDDETFFDFSNSPILYYHTEKNIPAYFSQSLQYIVDLYLQKECVKKLQRTKIPWVVYSQTIAAFGDEIDGIPNNIRYYYIASYLIDNYVPAGEHGLLHLWQKKACDDADSSIHEVRKENWELGLMPYYWKSNPGEPKMKFKRQVMFDNNKGAIGKIVGGDFIQLTVNSAEDTKLKMWMNGEEYNDFFVQLDIKKGTNAYKFPICGSYYLRSTKEPVLEFEIDAESRLLKIEILNQ